MKKTGVWVLAAMLSVSLLAGCSGSAKETAAPEQETAKAAETAAETEGAANQQETADSETETAEAVRVGG